MSDHGKTIIMDNGANSIKFGFASDNHAKIIPNCIGKIKSERRRPFIGDQLDECKEYSGLFYLLPLQKGYIVNWDLQRQIWDYVFTTKHGIKSFADYSLVFTEPYMNFRSVQENLLEVFYEEYGFKSMALSNPANFAAYNYKRTVKPDSLAALVVDAGYSFTHIVPIVQGKTVKSGIRRIDIGGKALTNHLKDIISYRQLHVLDETYVINQCKEDTCFVSLSLDKDLEEAKKRKNPFVLDYVLPDYSSVKRGYIYNPKAADAPSIADQQTIRLNNERFQVPELLFYPSDLGLNQIGISHAIYHSIESQPAEVRPHLYSNIILIGGCAKFENFAARIEQDIRSMANHLYDVKIHLPECPITEPWDGAKRLVENDSDYAKYCASKKEYDEKGSAGLLADKFSQ